MSDPTTAPMIEQLISSNGMGDVPSPQYAKLPTGNSTRRGELLAAVEAACKIVPGDFTAREVIKKLDSQGYAIQARDRAIAVNSALKRLLKRGLIHVTSVGSGKRPSTYRLTRSPREREGAAA